MRLLYFSVLINLSSRLKNVEKVTFTEHTMLASFLNWTVQISGCPYAVRAEHATLPYYD